jgi:hypothetical protein
MHFSSLVFRVPDFDGALLESFAEFRQLRGRYDRIDNRLIACHDVGV